MLNEIVEWFNEAVPEPTDRNRQVQVGVHFEEVTEMMTAFRVAGLTNVLADNLKGGRLRLPEPNRIELLDSLCDQIVTAVGVAHMYGMDIEGALTEVNRSNYSKFVDGHAMFNAQGKIAKPPTYTPPDLTPYV